MAHPAPQAAPETVTDSLFGRLQADFERVSLEKEHVKNMQDALSKQQDDLRAREDAMAQDKQETADWAAAVACREEEATSMQVSLEVEHEKLYEKYKKLYQLVAKAQARENELAKARSDLDSQITATRDAENKITERQNYLNWRHQWSIMRELAVKRKEQFSNTRESALDDSTENIRGRLEDVELREYAVQEREAGLVAEEGRVQKLKQNAERSTTQSGPNNDDGVLDAECYFIEDEGVALCRCATFTCEFHEGQD